MDQEGFGSLSAALAIASHRWGTVFFRGAAPAAGLRMNPACMAFMESQKPEMGDLVLVFPTAPLLYRIKMEFL